MKVRATQDLLIFGCIECKIRSTFIHIFFTDSAILIKANNNEKDILQNIFRWSFFPWQKDVAVFTDHLSYQKPLIQDHKFIPKCNFSQSILTCDKKEKQTVDSLWYINLPPSLCQRAFSQVKRNHVISQYTPLHHFYLPHMKALWCD